MRSFQPLLLLILFAVPAVAPAQAGVAGDNSDPLAIGRRIYREGLLPSGQPLQGVGPAGVTLSGSQAACTTCHRRSGYGSSEGTIEVRAITGPALFGERVAPVAPGSLAVPPPPLNRHGERAVPASPLDQAAAAAARDKSDALRAARAAMFAGTRQRPTYDDDSLARAIREGVDVTGRTMNASMPRFTLDAAELQSLQAYLRTLSAAAAPGVTDDKVHFATVIQPGVDPAQRRALVELLETYFRDRNRGQRAEIRREQAGQVHLGRTYREWALHVWDLQGPGEGWPAQLDAYYREQPVFAMVSGLGAASWRPIHEFSERAELPCILPQAVVPELDEPDIYTVYISKGMTLEAQALAKYLHDAGEHGPVLQIHGGGAASTTAAAAFRQAWAANSGAALNDQALGESPDEAYWTRLASQNAGATLVLWLDPAELAHAQALTTARQGPKAIYLSSALLGESATVVLPDPSGRVRLVYPQDPPARRAARLAVVSEWMHNNGLELTQEKVQLDAYLAATVTGMMVSHSKDTYSREFLLERMEHRLGTGLELSIYPHLSLGPGQRFASKGSYILQRTGAGGAQLQAVSDWVVP